MSPEAFVISLLLVCGGLLSSEGAQDSGHVATFFGGQYRVNLRLEDRFLTVSLNFRTSQETAILFIARLKDNSGYFSVGLAKRLLVATVKHYESTQRLTVGSVNTSEWQTLSVHLRNRTLRLSLNSQRVMQMLPSDVAFKDIYFGGPHTFFAGLYTDLTITKYFVGCLGNVSVMNKSVMFVVRENEYGMKLGCCPDPIPPSWCFNTSDSSLRFRAVLNHVAFSQLLNVSMEIRAHSDGIVLFSHTNMDSIAFEVHGGVLVVVICTRTQSFRVSCPRVLTDRTWHSLVVEIRQTQLSCSVDGESNYTALSLQDLPDVSMFYVGSPNITVQEIPQILSHLNLQQSGGRLNSFLGCIRNLQFNNIDIDPGTLHDHSPAVSDACLSPVSPLPTSPPPVECSQLEKDNISWEDLAISAFTVSVNESSKVTITTDHLRLQLPANMSSNSLLAEQIYNTSLFSINVEPHYGFFATSQSPQNQITSFSYEDVRQSRVIYNHGGQEYDMDHAVLDVSVVCGEHRFWSMNTTLLFAVILQNDIPEVLRRKEMHIVVGTRKVVTSDIITVVDGDSNNSHEILFRVKGVGVDKCGLCKDNSAGRLERTTDLGLAIAFFSQDDVDQGHIFFQHFAEFGTAPVTVYLSAIDGTGGAINTHIEVLPHEGHINLTTNECLIVVEGTSSVLRTKHLNATTTFEEQDPVLTYDIVVPPRYGHLEQFVQYDPENNSTWLWDPLSSFTQKNIIDGLIRYVHDNSTQPVQAGDVFQFSLRSTNLSGPAGNFCIQVISYQTLQQPNIVVNVSTITVLEGQSVVIRESVLSSSLAPPILIEWLEEKIGIEHLGIAYVLERPPACGEFLLDGRPLKNNSFTLSDIRSGLVTYNHSGSENHIDSFTFFAESRSRLNEIRSPDRTARVEANIVIIPMNDHKPVLKVGNVSVPEGGWVRITPTMINIEDEDLPKDTINIFLRQPNLERNPTGHFAFYEHAMVPIRSFTMQNISDGQVIFKHHLNAAAPLTYMQYLRVDDGNVNHTVQESITVTAIPLVVKVAPINLPNNSQCFAEVDATAESLSVPLLRESMSISVNDLNGNDPNRINSVTITIATVPNFGQILRSPNDTVVDFFKGYDLQNSTIFYHFSNRTAVTKADTFSLEFRYGHGTSGPVPFTVCINHIPIPILNYTREISLARGSLSPINTTHLLATDTRGGLNNLLYYNITASPRHGILFNQSSADSNIHVQNFTQEDVNNGLIAYSHRDNVTAEMRDSFQFQVCTFSAPPGDKGSTHYACIGMYELTFVLHVVNLTIINNGFEVNETSQFIITISELNAIAPQGFYVEFHIPENGGPKNGELNLAGPIPHKNIRHFQLRQLAYGRIFYKHTRQETLHDSFEFTALAINNEESNRHEMSGVVNIRVIPANDWPPEFVNREVLHVVKRAFAVISSDILEAHDSDSDMRDEDLVYEMPPHFPFYGYIYYREAPSVKIYRWTEGDLRQNRVFYNHTGSILDIISDLIGFYITDGKHREFSSLRVVIRDIILEDIAPCSGKFMVTEGMQAVITKKYLQYNATNDDTLSNEHYTYNIVANPTHGTLQFNNSTATTFTQQDLETGRLVYTHDNSNTVKDSFNFTITISIREATSETYTFPIKIIPVDDDAPEVRYIERPLFVLELDIVKISSREIEIYDLDSQTAEQTNNVSLTLIDRPQYGLIQKFRHTRFVDNASDFNKFDLDQRDNVQYNHTELGHYFDYFVFNITDGINPQNEIYRVDIVILPWVIPLNISGVSVSEGGALSLERDNFEVLHPHLRDAPGCISVTMHPRHGSLISTKTGANISNFTTSELENGSIVYRHIGDESTYDEFEFTYDAHEINNYDRRSNTTRFPIYVIPVNDEPPVLRTRATISLWVGEKITLDQTYLNATDLDTPAEFLRYNFSVNIDGFIAYSDSPPKGHIQNFTQADVDAGRVVFKHDAELDGSLVFSVSDGVQSVQSRINVSAQYLRLRCETAAPLSVSMGGNVTITHNQLDCATNDYSRPTPREIFYDARELEYGKILVGSVETTRFNQSAVNNGLVTYVHTDLDRWESEEVPLVSASTLLANSPELSLIINITHPSTPHSKLAVNRRLELVEGGQVCLDESVLDARNIRYRTWNEFRDVFSTVHELTSVFSLSDLPKHGTITISGNVRDKLPIRFNQTLLATGSVCYRHDDSDTQSDSLHFQLTIEPLNSSLATLNDSTFEDSLTISITPVNDEWPKLVTTELKVDVVNGIVFNFTQDVLEIQDQDNTPEELEYVIMSTPENGRLVLGNSTVKRFKQVDINNGLLQFQPLGVGNGSFSFTFNDVNHTNETNITFLVCVVAHTLDILSNEEATYKQNEGLVTITTDLLNTVTNGNRGDTHFRVTRGPSHGKIIGPTDVRNFTQMDIDSGVVQYRNTDLSSHNDSFQVDIVNRKVTKPNVTIYIRVVVWGEVKTTEELDFSSGFSRPLSQDLLNLDQLQSALHEPPEIEVITFPRYGYLELKYDNTVRKRSTFSFSYVDLKDGLVFYTWDSTENYTVMDSVTVLVQGGKQGLQPGEARINITIHPPTPQTQIPSSPLFSSTSSTDTPTSSTSNPPQDGFPMYALIPILGIFFILVIMIAVVVVFCLSQQKRIRKKWQPKVANTTHPYPWSVSPTTLPRPGMSTRYDFDPTVPGSEIENAENNSETSSGFSEPNTPIGNSPNPVHYNHQVPRPRIGRVHSNVSITLLPRSSVASDVSLEDHNYFSLPRQPPPQVAVPVPIRPISHSPVRRSSVESGCLRPAAETSGYETSTRNMPTPTETSISANPSPLPPSENSVTDTPSGERSKPAPVGASDKSLDPELLKLFRSSPPLLKKHEYWV